MSVEAAQRKRRRNARGGPELTHARRAGDRMHCGRLVDDPARISPAPTCRACRAQLTVVELLADGQLAALLDYRAGR